ncbi:hypothetical protein [Catenulispora rubra]|uniref:hypothetical protein n=1 Tax=Catenulispora rubra TaxID=280293 RepID=UPI0018923863|nr:hypothetical protein [Catenulispora rubra]
MLPSGRLGDVAFGGGFGTVSLDEAARATLKVHTGEVSIARLTGRVRMPHPPDLPSDRLPRT